MENRRGQMKNELAESLRQLMLRSLFEKITIRQICERAGVIRATFYNYFDDKYDCLDWIVYHDMVEKNEDRINMNGMDSPVYDVLETIAENRAFYRAAYNVIGQNSFEDMIRGNLAKLLKLFFDRYRKPSYLPSYDNELLAAYYANGLAFCVRQFVFEKEGCTSVESTRRMISSLMKNSFYDYLQQ
ncbi:MAG: TetR/AcrR family transcriptional regulator C-terminal domain-containing protein [Solobacterium sp.]|nr:TetR/AcrR family transcriptional regulator C-terminal domain-containing protein [Solobacterium sp.]